jgi:cytochrome P450
MSETVTSLIMNTNIRSVYDTKSIFMGTESIPVLRGLPGIGVAMRLHKNPIRFFSETVNRYGDRVELRVLGRRVLLLTNPADVETILVQNTADFEVRWSDRSFAPAGLLV